MKQVYFSHSYRDREINEYFLALFREQAVKLVADQKSKTWCVPKLERFMIGSDGFVAVVPQRKSEDGGLAFSPYIQTEIELARRARIPWLVFADEVVLSRFRNLFPIAAVPFRQNNPRVDENAHRRAVAQFIQQLESFPRDRLAGTTLRQCSVFFGAEATRQNVLKPLAQLLEENSYTPRLFPLKALKDCVHDMSPLETIWSSEFSVFFLENRLNRVEVALALAHAACHPAFRLTYDEMAKDGEVGLNGLLRWRNCQQVLGTFTNQFQSYLNGFLEIVTQASSQQIGAWLRELVPPDWDPADPLSLVKFVHVGDPHLQNDLYAIRTSLGAGFPDLLSSGRQEDLCRAAYERIKSYEWFYEFEPGNKDYSRQSVRAPVDMYAHRVGTCLDFACLFGALFEIMQADPVILRLTTLSAAHALAGSWQKNRTGMPLIRDCATIQQAVRQGDLLLFEATGAARAQQSVAGEQRGLDSFLTFDKAREAALRLLERPDVSVDFLLDIIAAR
jgi:hypothetical protein